MNQAIRALIVDDEGTIRHYLRETLQRTGYGVVTAADGEQALRLIRDECFDVAVIDLHLGGKIDGLRLLEALRWRWPATAVVILTAYGSLQSALEAIRDGVDGYLLKPAKPGEIRETVKQALNRRRRLRGEAEPEGPPSVTCGAFCVDLQTREASRDGEPLALTPQEFSLLTCLVQNAPRVISPVELVQAIREGTASGREEAADIIKWYIHRLRQQIEPDPSRPSHIITVRGVGYRFEA